MQLRMPAGAACGPQQRRAAVRAAAAAPALAPRAAVSRSGRASLRRAPLRVAASAPHGGGGGGGHGHGHGGPPNPNEEKNKGFIAEMRTIAMKLHTKDQAPKEGERPAPKPQAWAPTREGYLRFLAESKAVYDAFDAAVKTSPQYAPFAATGLERSAALARDIQWFEATYGLKAPALTDDGPGRTYAKLIAGLAGSNPQAFICHYYNFYFAHTAGGRMIGSKVAGMLLEGKSLAFYEWEGDVNGLLDGVRRSINGLAEGWSREQKDHCLQETEASFKYSGVIMSCMSGTH